MYYNICKYCGAYLDPGERCDCKDSVSEYRSIKASKNALLKLPHKTER